MIIKQINKKNEGLHKKEKKACVVNPKLRCNIQSDSQKLLSGPNLLRKTGDKQGLHSY